MKKSLKKQAVFPVLMLLVVTALALIGSSFAWFAMTNVANVTTFTSSVEKGSTGLMISANGEDYVGTVTLGTATSSDKKTQLSTTWIKPDSLHQVSTADGINFFEAHIESKDNEGNVATITSSADESHPASNLTAGSVALPTWDHDNNPETAVVERTAHMIIFDLYFQVDVAADLYLNAGTQVVYNGTDKGAQDAIRVAFLAMGSETTTTAIKTKSNASPSVIIWNPSGDAHTYGLKATSDTAFPAYSIEGAAASKAASNGELTGTAIIPTSDLSQATGEPSQSAIASLVAGYNKVRVLIWLEGQDEDCIVDIAEGSFAVTLNFYAYSAS